MEFPATTKPQERKFFTDKLEVRLPSDFTNSINEKFIRFDFVRVMYIKGEDIVKLILDIDLHSRDLPMSQPSYDGYIMACNWTNISKIFRIDNYNMTMIKFFFMQMGTNFFDIEKCKFFIEMTLIF
jgi:hypothetical protein